MSCINICDCADCYKLVQSNIELFRLEREYFRDDGKDVNVV